MKFDITFLGTGQAIPTASRNHISIFISCFGEGMLFDCGEGTQRQFRKAGISPTKIDKIFISHWHGDHVLGLPGLIQTMALSNHHKTLTIYGPKGSKRNISEIMNVFPHHQKFRIEVQEIEDGIVFKGKNFHVESSKMDHTIPCLAYSIVEKDQLRIDKNKLKSLKIPNSPILGKIKEGKDIVVDGKKIKAKSLTSFEKGLKVTMIFDTKENKNSVSLAKNSDILICESTYGDKEEEIAKEYKHMTARQAAKLAKKSKSKKLLLTHFSQRYERNEKELLKQASEVFKQVSLTNDLDRIVI